MNVIPPAIRTSPLLINTAGVALPGQLADLTSITFVYRVCAFLPALGLFTALLPNVEPPPRRARKTFAS